MSGGYGQFTPGTDQAEFNALSFLIQQALLKMQTVTLVRVVAVHGGGVVPAGTVDVQPMVNQMTGNRVAVSHGTIYGVPFFRVQGGVGAIICDPVAGDIGLCAFASRDISAVKSTKAPANPGSQRTFDWADGLYLGGFLNVAPTAYLEFNTDHSITLVSPVKVTIQAPAIDLEGSTSITINSPAVHITGGGTQIDGKTFLTHEHSGVQSGGSNTGGVV